LTNQLERPTQLSAACPGPGRITYRISSGPLDKIVMRQRYKPGKGWKYLASGVWEHVSGLRISVSGRICRLPDKTIFPGRGSWWWDSYFEQSKFIRVAGGNKKRGLMAWARNLLSA